MTKRKTRKDAARDSALTRIEAALADRSDTLTASARVVAAFARDNLSQIPFETGASIAAKTGVSEMTVIRGIQSLGFANLRELKAALRAERPGIEQSVGEVLELFHARKHDLTELQASLELQLEAIVKAYDLATTERWQTVVDLLASRRTIFIVGLLATKGVALDFASRMMTARAGIRFVDGTDGLFVEVLEAEPAESCLVLVDTVHRTRDGPALAQAARDRGFPIVMITNSFSNWGYEYTDLILQGVTKVNTFWDSTASLSVIANLLIDSVAIKLGKQAETHYEFMRGVGKYFGAFEWAKQAPVDPLRKGTSRRRSRRS